LGGLLVLVEMFSAFYFELLLPLLVAQFAGGIVVGVLMGATS